MSGESLNVLNEFITKPLTERFKMTFAEVYEAWKSEHFRDISHKGKEGYETAFKHFSELHEQPFRNLRTDHFQAVVDSFVAKGRSHSSADKLRQLIGQMSQWALREEIVTTNFAQFIKLPERVKKEKEIFSQEEIEKLWESGNDAAKITLMLIFTGMRIGELFTLDVDKVYEKYCIGGEKTEAGKNRIIPIPSEVRSLFSYFKEQAPVNGLLINGYEGNREVANFRARDYYPMIKMLGIKKKTPHSTRHTYASMAVKAGVRPELLQKILGHADYGTTANEYVHSDIDSLVEAAEKIGNSGKAENHCS